MRQEKPDPRFVTERGLRVALIFALTAQRLSDFYEHNHWLTEAQGASLAADWLSRSSHQMSRQERQQLSALSDQLAREISGTLSREAGLFTAHEMTEALDPNFHSEIAESLMAECERLLDGTAQENDDNKKP